MFTLENAIALYIAYLFGSISCAIIICKLLGLPDPCSTGSNNPGATNVLRIAGKKAALLTLIGDVLKGAIPILLARCYGFELVMLGWIGLAAFLGHLFPIYFHFRGGKGVATAIGVIFALAWPVGVCWIATWGVIALLFRYVSLASLCAAAMTPLYIWYWSKNESLALIFVMMSLLLFIRHRENISRLWQGTENRMF